MSLPLSIAPEPIESAGDRDRETYPQRSTLSDRLAWQWAGDSTRLLWAAVALLVAWAVAGWAQ